ncbi:MAG: hypothetical protein IJ599_04540 [Alphaproteobacteria bacterium]|nr:hypothetical protein [Alphaproteobacteria bacterium]
MDGISKGYPFEVGSLIDVADDRYDLYDLYNGGIVPALFGQGQIRTDGAPLKEIFRMKMFDAQEVVVSGITDNKFDAVPLKMAGYIEKGCSVYFSLGKRELATMNFTTQGSFIHGQLFPKALDDISRCTDRLALSAITGLGVDDEVGVKGMQYRVSTHVIETKMEKLPLTRYIPLDFQRYVRYQPTDPAYFDPMGIEGLSFAKIAGVASYFNSISTGMGRVVLVVPKSTLSYLYIDPRYLQSRNVSELGLPAGAERMVQAFTFMGVDVIGIPDNHFPAPTNVYHTMEGGAVKMFGTNTAQEKNAPTACIKYGYAFITNNVSIDWGFRSKLGDAGMAQRKEAFAKLPAEEQARMGGSVPQIFIFPVTKYDPIGAKLEILFESDIFFGRMRNEGVLVVEINGEYNPLENYANRRSVIVNNATVNNATVTAATTENATVNNATITNATVTNSTTNTATVN